LSDKKLNEFEKKYRITINDKHITSGEQTESETELMGNLSVQKNGYEIRYMEHTGDMAGTTTKIFVDEPNKVRLTRGGLFQTDLILELKKRHNCCYETPYGTLIMGVYAHRIDSNMNPDGGDLEFSYSLDVGGGEVLENELKISVRKIDNVANS